MSEPSDPNVSPESPEAPAAPQYVSIEDFKRLEATIAGQAELTASINQNLQSLAAQAGRRAAEAAPVAGAELTDEQIDAAVDEGRMSRSQASRLIAKREIAALQKDVIDPLQSTGLNAIGGVVREMALPKMPYYTKYKVEIDKYIDGLPPNVRLSPEVYVGAHNLVVGAHMNEIVEETREATVRSAAAPKPEVVAVTGRTGRTNAAGTVPTVAELMGDTAAKALESKGKSADQLAQSLGYKDWKAYAELAIKQEQGVA